MDESAAIREGILRSYERFSAGETRGFAEVIFSAPGVSVIGSGPGEGHDGRVLPDGRRLPTRLTAVLHREGAERSRQGHRAGAVAQGLYQRSM